MAWILLMIAGLLEVGWAVGLEFTQGFTKLWPSVLTTIGMIASVFLLALAVQKIPLGTAYAIWTGIGAVGTAALGIVLFDESAAPSRLFFIGLIVVSIAGLKITSGH
jgi:quaternary ammonium compound-resistance protein SugE